MKIITTISAFLIFSILGNAQTLIPKNISKIVDDVYNQKKNAFLEKNGFQNWTATENGQNWYNQKTNESVELIYDQKYYKEGGKHTVAIYYLENGLHKNFVNQLAAAKFVYSKRNKHYVRRFNTYTYETIKIELIGKNANITYINHLGKEDGSFPGFQIPEPPKQDTIIKKEKYRNDTIVRKYIGTRQVEKSRFSNGKLVAKKNFVTGDFKKFNENAQLIYHSYPNKKDKEYLVIEYDREGKEKYRSVYQEKSKEMIIYNYGIITERRKEIAGGKESITKYDKTGNITTTTEEYISYGVQDYDESEY